MLVDGEMRASPQERCGAAQPQTLIALARGHPSHLQHACPVDFVDYYVDRSNERRCSDVPSHIG